MNEQILGTTAAEPANFDDRLASIISRNEGMTQQQESASAKTPSARDAHGRFVKVDENGYEHPIEPAKADAEPAKPAAQPKDAKQPEEPAADDEDYLELPAEQEGGEPTRLKVSEVLSGFNEAKTLRGEIETLRSTSRQMPADVEKELGEVVAARQQYVNGINALQKLMQIPQPNSDLINPASPNHNPDLYFAQLQQAEQIKHLHASLTQEAERVEKEQSEHRTKLHNAKIAREMDALLKAWPEFKDTQVQQKFVEDAGKAYGLTAQEIASVTSARDYTILRDALAYRALKATQETAAKVVKAKPKLVRGSARQPSGKQAAYSDAMDRLTKSHSIEDGLEALRALNL